MLRRDGGREELAEQVEGAWCVRVRALGSEARHVAREEVQLLVALEVDAVRAAPAVVSLEDDGYLREWAAPMRHGSGRRAAAETSPDTAEREALGRAREDLEALLESLHGRGWVLGATPGAGLGLREDGTVVVTDLEGLRMSSAPGSGAGTSPGSTRCCTTATAPCAAASTPSRPRPPHGVGPRPAPGRRAGRTAGCRRGRTSDPPRPPVRPTSRTPGASTVGGNGGVASAPAPRSRRRGPSRTRRRRSSHRPRC